MNSELQSDGCFSSEAESGICGAALGSDHPLLSRALNKLGTPYTDRGKIDEAEALYRRAREIQQKAFEAERPHVARMLNSLAGVWQQRRRQNPEAADINRGEGDCATG